MLKTTRRTLVAGAALVASLDEIPDLLEKQRGRQFDPECAAAFLDIRERIREAMPRPAMVANTTLQVKTVAVR